MFLLIKTKLINEESLFRKNKTETKITKKKFFC